MNEGMEVVSSRGVVASNPAAAARVGARILEAGGNAMDAAVAAGFACCMLRPNQTGVGGYCCVALVREGASGVTRCVDANGMAPAAAHDRMFATLPVHRDSRGWINEGEYRCVVPGDANVFGPLSITVPGMMAGMGIIHERWGCLPWDRIIAPSQQMIADGIPYEEVADAIKQMEPHLRAYPASVTHLMPGGRVPEPDEIWHRPDMEKTLSRLAGAGWRDFYEGQIGRQIADHIRALGGVLSREDMACYQPRIVTPYSIPYRNATIHGTVLPNGCLSSLQALMMFAQINQPADDSVAYWHVLAEVLKLAWRDRLRYLGDPGFVEVPIQRLLNPEYAAGRVETIRQFPAYVDRLVPPPIPDTGNGTLHLSTADAAGNLVAMTITQGNSFGSCVTVPGTGVILGHGMCRLDPRPGQLNSIAPRKRPLNNTAGMMIELPDRIVAAGQPGGRRIVSVMPRVAQMLVDRGGTGFQAATAARIHIETNEPIHAPAEIGKEVIAGLTAMGHEVVTVDRVGGVVNCAEYFKIDGHTRAGSAQSSAGAD